MAESEHIEKKPEEGERKIVEQYIPVTQQILTPLWVDANAAEVNRDTRAPYLTRIFDEVSEIARVKYGSDKDAFNEFMADWEQLDKDYGDLDSKKYRLDIKEWRERKRVLTRMREKTGMGTSAPTGKYEPGDPMEMWRCPECPEGCPQLISERKKGQAYE